MNIKKLQKICKKSIELFNFEKAYFAEKIGRRISFLVAAGNENYLPKHRIDINSNIVFFYYSSSPVNNKKVKNFILEELKNEN